MKSGSHRVDKAAVSRALKSLEALGLIAVTAASATQDVILTASDARCTTRRRNLIASRGTSADGFSQPEQKVLVEFLNRMIAQMPAVSACPPNLPHRRCASRSASSVCVTLNDAEARRRPCSWRACSATINDESWSIHMSVTVPGR